jgi:hypothetical protein
MPLWSCEYKVGLTALDTPQNVHARYVLRTEYMDSWFFMKSGGNEAFVNPPSKLSGQGVGERQGILPTSECVRACA